MPGTCDVMVVDYGMGNLFNLQKVLDHVGAKSLISSDPTQINHADRLILPGVGAFEDGIKHLKNAGMAQAIDVFIKTGKPMLGICLGMQLLMEHSHEGGLHQGLSQVQGSVERFLSPLSDGAKFKIPHIGWNSLNFPPNRAHWKNTIFTGIKPGDYVYFVHSYTVCPKDGAIVLAQTQYGRQTFCSAFMRENVYGCQFHPEISGPVGLNIFEHFLKV